MKIIVTVAVAAIALAGAANAKGHVQKETAKGMADTIQSLGNGSDPANTVTGGWGNLAGPAVGKSGNEVRGKGKPAE